MAGETALDDSQPGITKDDLLVECVDILKGSNGPELKGSAWILLNELVGSEVTEV